MANISSAAGTLAFTVRGTEEDLRYAMRTILHETRTWTYDTYVDDGEIEKSPVISSENGISKSSVFFDGNGRWAYECNVESMCDILKKRLPTEDIEKLKAMDFVIRFEYADEESVCGVLYEKVEELRHKSGFPLKDTIMMTMWQQV